jgi:hypothetical protein
MLTSDLTGDGNEEVILGTSKGLHVISNGTSLYRILTPGPIMDIVLLNNGAESSPQLVLAVNDTYFPNIRCYEGTTGARLWDFVPTQEVFIDNVMWAQQQTPTFDIEAVDLNQDGSDDIVATSGYNVFALDGAGHQLWQFTASNNLWRVSPVPDVDGDGMPDIVTGSQVGLMYLLSGKDGTVIWQDKIADTYTTINEKGQPGNTVDRSVWDIVPLAFWGETKVIVSTEDGKVRLIDLRDGEVEWDVTLVEYVAAEEHKKYERKMGRPTSPGDANFFNIRLTLTDDVTDDGMPEVLAAMYTGRGGNGEAGSSARNSGLALIDPATGATLFERSNMSLEQAGQMDTTLYNDRDVLLVPVAIRVLLSEPVRGQGLLRREASPRLRLRRPTHGIVLGRNRMGLSPGDRGNGQAGGFHRRRYPGPAPRFSKLSIQELGEKRSNGPCPVRIRWRYRGESLVVSDALR